MDFMSMYGDTPEDVHYNYFPDGTYYVYLHWKDKGMEITTSKLYFQVRKPDKHQQKVFNEFLNVLRILQNKNKKIEGAKLLNQLIKKYPKSIYTPVMYRWLLIKYKYWDKYKNLQKEKIFFDLTDQFIHTYPDHPYAKSALGYILGYFRFNKNKDGAIKYFTKLKQENLDPGLNKNIQKIILKRILTSPIEDW